MVYNKPNTSPDRAPNPPTHYSPSKYNKWSSLVGAVLITMPLGLVFFWGNLYVYVGSFLIERLHEESGVQAPWILTLKASLTALVGLLARFIRGPSMKRVSVLAGICLMCGSYALSYVAIQHSYMAFALIFGCLYGLGDGLILFVVMDFTLDWIVEENAGFYLSVGYSGMCQGAIVANQFISRYINPQNLKAEDRLGHSLFFTQTDILDRTPKAFLYLAAGSFVVQMSGFLMLRSKTDKETSPSMKDEGQQCTSIQTTTMVEKANNNIVVADDSDKIIQSFEVLSTIQDEEEKDSLTSRQMLRKPHFYLIFISFVFNYQLCIVANNYYKSFGEVWIHDDHFLTAIGSVMPATSTISCVVWGFLLDKFRLKTCLVALSGTQSLTSVIYYFVPPLGKWVFCGFTLVHVSVSAAAFSVYSVASVKAFGKSHQSSNFSILYTATLATLAFSPMCEAILLHAGWFYLFFTSAALNVASMLGFLLFFNENTLYRDCDNKSNERTT